MKKKSFPVGLSFDVDGETLWTARDPENAKRPVQLSMGAYGLIEGVPRILKLLAKYELPASFFVPGMICERYPDVVRRIAGMGHEIGNHGYSHTHPHKFSAEDAERNELIRTSALIEKLSGKPPKGYRSPAWEFSPRTVNLLRELGIDWSSNMMHTDQIHRLEVFGQKTDIVEIPVSWMLDDAAYWLYSLLLVGKAMQPLAAVEEYWKTEFEELYREYMEDEAGERKNQCYMLTCHPQVIGRPARMKLLETVVCFIRSFPNVEFMTGAQMRDRYRKLANEAEFQA
ncbi:MAG: polysaccharide deacetylase [Desulfovibrio sp.]|nr:polysaccharide deacetylase [Desulfovibrio sp.]